MIYIELDEKIKEKIEKITGIIYEAKGNFISNNIIECLFDDLIYEYDTLKEEYEDFKRDIEDNYVHRPMSNYTGDSYDDRF